MQPFDDGNDSGTNYADAQQACSADFAMVGNASGFDDGSAQAVGACGIPTMAAEVSTAAAGNTADVFGASPATPTTGRSARPTTSSRRTPTP